MEPRTKAAAVPSQQDHSNAGIRLYSIERPNQLIEHLVCQSVALVRTIQGDRRDVVLDTGVNERWRV